MISQCPFSLQTPLPFRAAPQDQHDYDFIFSPNHHHLLHYLCMGNVSGPCWTSRLTNFNSLHCNKCIFFFIPIHNLLVHLLLAWNVPHDSFLFVSCWIALWISSCFFIKRTQWIFIKWHILINKIKMYRRVVKVKTTRNLPQPERSVFQHPSSLFLSIQTFMKSLRCSINRIRFYLFCFFSFYWYTLLLFHRYSVEN